MSKNNFPRLAFAGLLSVVASVAHAMPSNFGVPAYWAGPANTYSGQVPKDAYIVINPNSGALKLSSADISRYKAIIASIRSQGGLVLRYVPTGFSEKPGPQLTRYSNIGANLAAYKTTLGGVDGIFFDEAAWDNADSKETPQLTDSQKCVGTEKKWTAIRSTLKAAGVSGTIVWNAGTWGSTIVLSRALQKGAHRDTRRLL